jgi:3D-(3,5/4)-trihydroxycyclohexane-1,2-dione acylhydrolase (decyclizing)
VALEELAGTLQGYRVSVDYQDRVNRFRAGWEQEVDRIYNLGHGPPLSQGEVIGAVNYAAGPRDVVVCAAGSLPGDLHKLWRTRDPNSYHLEYGYSCMGYEIAGGLGAKMADPSREVYVMVGDGSYLMMAQEIHTSLQEGYKLNIVLLDSHGFSSIGGLSRSVGCQGFGTEYRFRSNGKLQGEINRVDFVANAASLGALSIGARTSEELKKALAQSRSNPRTTVVVVEVDAHEARVPIYESWWDVPVAEISNLESVETARKPYIEGRKRERYYF